MAVGVLLATSPAPAAADGDLVDKQRQVDAKIDQARTDLDSVSAQLQRAADALARAREGLPAARKAYAAARLRLSGERDNLALIRQRLRELEATREKIQAAIEQAQTRIERSKITIGRIVRFEYQTGGFAELQTVLDSESPGDFVQRLVATQSVVDSESVAIDNLAANQSVLVAQEQQRQVTSEAIGAARDEALERVATLQSLAATARTAKDRIETLISARQEALAVARSQRAVEEQRLADLKRAQRSLQDRISSLSSNGGSVPDGELVWPVDGAVIQGVGWRVHPVYGYRSCHTGLDIPASAGSPIRAASDGVVVWAESDAGDPNGLNSLIDHGNGLSTLYAHQSRMSVAAGDRVRAGEVIGFVGSTGYSTGNHLHFEVRVNGVAYDPMGWFGGDKRPQSQFCP
jgi:murein DD-endopeptidase MepM/ murein hydrolase activator NlpD